MNKKSTKRSLLFSVLALILCCAMLAGTTLAWFTDTASTAVNKIQAGTLDIALEMKQGDEWVNAEGETLQFKKAAGHESEAILWEPGCTYELPELRIVNKGNLALKYKLIVNGVTNGAAAGDVKLMEVLEWSVKVGSAGAVSLDAQEGSLLPATSGVVSASDGIVISAHMKEDAGNEYQGLSITGIGITVAATQMAHEFDSIDDQYDAPAWDGIDAFFPLRKATAITRGENNTIVDANGDALTNITVTETDTSNNTILTAEIPVEAIADDATEVVVTVNDNATADAAFTATAGLDSSTLDIHVSGLRESNSTPVKITIPVEPGLDDFQLSHRDTRMTPKNSADAVTADQEYYYDRITGNLTLMSATFSPFTYEYKPVVAVNANTGVCYSSLEAAAESAQQNEIVVLLENVTLTQDIATPAQLAIVDTIVLDLAGHTINSTYEGVSIWNYGIFTINDSSATKTGIIHNTCKTNGNGNYGHDAVRNSGTLTINGGTFGDSDLDKTNANTEHRGAAVRNLGTCTINGGNFTAGDNYFTWGNGINYTYAIRSSGTMIINGGTVYGKMNGGVAADGGTIKITDGDFSVAAGNSTYHVLAKAGNATFYISGGMFNCQSNKGHVFSVFEGMPSWDVMPDLEENGYYVTGGTFIDHETTLDLTATA